MREWGRRGGKVDEVEERERLKGVEKRRKEEGREKRAGEIQAGS